LNRLTCLLLASLLFSTVQANETLVLGNDAWPPFIIDGDQQGTSEKIVCQALERSGWTCSLRVNDWDMVLQEARAGSIDGIAAAWRNPDREEYLLFSEPYLTNRIIPIVNRKTPVSISETSDLKGKRVALVTDYAYGDEIAAMAGEFEVVEARNPLEAIRAVRNGMADVALMDELVARDELGDNALTGVFMAGSVLAFRDLHFAVSRKHPQAEQIIADFHRAFELMLDDGTVNEILNIDWLATDFGHSGRVDVVLRSGVSLDDLSHPSEDGSVYALESSEYQFMRQSTVDPSRVNYQVEGTSHSTLQSALNTAFGKNIACQHKEFSSEFDCTQLLKNLRSDQN
jgi:ABC-type amino acid transport substrate-binding protein